METPRHHALVGDELAAVALLWRRNGRELRARFGGSSMEPSLAPESEVLLRCGAPASAGDIVAFLAEGLVVLHRVEVVCARHGSLLTRGDALWLPDPLVRPEAVLGIVTAVERGGKLEPPPPPPQSAARRVALWPFRAALAASPAAVAAALAGLLWSRRIWFSARRRLGSLFKASWA